MEATKIEDARDYGNAVRVARKEAGLSQVQLAERCGCSQRFVSEVERGKTTAELGKALKLLVAIGVPVTVGSVRPAIDGRAEVHYALVRIADGVDARGRKKRKLSDYLEEPGGGGNG